MEEFEALRFMKAESLTPPQIQAIVAIRNAIPNPTTGTMMQKVIKGSGIQDFIDQNRDIGWVAHGFSPGGLELLGPPPRSGLVMGIDT